MSHRTIVILLGVGVLIWLVAGINVNATIITGEPTITYKGTSS